MKIMIDLKHTRNKIGIQAKEPFNFKYTVMKPSHFYTALEYYDEHNRCFYRSMRLGEKLIGLKMRPIKQQNNERGVQIEIFSDKYLDNDEIEKIRNKVVRSYGLKEDIEEFYFRIKDRNDKKIIKRMNGMRNSCFENLFEILNISVVLQNTSVKRSQQMMETLLSNYGSRILFDGVILDVFYSPERLCKVSEEELRKLKLGYRAKYILEIAKFFSERKSFEDEVQKLNYSEAKKELLKIMGIGPYSANLALFSYLRSPEFINFDVWNKKIISKYLFGKDVGINKLEEECEKRWGQYKGYMTLYVIEDYFVRNPELQYWKEKIM